MLSTIQDVLKQVCDEALVLSGDSLTVDGHKAAKVVVQNLALAKEAYEQLLVSVQAQKKTAKKGEVDATFINLCVLMALGGGIANVTGDDSYVTRIHTPAPQ